MVILDVSKCRHLSRNSQKLELMCEFTVLQAGLVKGSRNRHGISVTCKIFYSDGEGFR